MNKTSATQMVTQTCQRCGGSGRFALGTCYRCGGAGVVSYTATYVARRDAAAKGRRSRELARAAEAKAANDARLAAMTEAELVEWVSETNLIGHDGLVEVWVDFKAGTTERVTILEAARRMAR